MRTLDVPRRRPELFPALLLNADYTPVSPYPHGILTWQDAVKRTMSKHERVVPVVYHDMSVRTAGGVMFRLPAVVALKKYQTMERKVAFTRVGVYMRDRFRCGYCSKFFGAPGDWKADGDSMPKRWAENLTFDHVVPRSKGGMTIWENIITACTECNLWKGDKTLKQSGFVLRTLPTVPTRARLNALAAEFPPPLSRLHRCWLPWMGLSADASQMTATELLATSMEQVAGHDAFPKAMTDEAYWNAELEA